MESFERKAILTAMATCISYLLGGFDTGIQVLLVMTAIDYITGMLKAIVQRNLNSYIGWRGIIRKAGVFVTIIVAVQIEILINQPELLHNVVAFAFVVNEGISILENLIEIDVPVPNTLVRYLKNMRDNADKGDEKK